MGWFSARPLPIRIVRDQPIRIKLAATVALSLPIGVSLFALDRLHFVTMMQANVATQSVVEHKLQRSMPAAQELRVVSRELQLRQTVSGVHRTMERTFGRIGLATTQMREVKAGPDQTLLDDAFTRFNILMNAVKKAGDLRSDIVTARQKRLFQVRPTFQVALTTSMNELARGTTMDGGVASVRDTATTAQADQHDPTVGAVNRYRLAMSRMQAGATMFMATGNRSAANDVRDATTDSATAIAAVLSGPAPVAVKTDARLVDNIGLGIASTSADPVAMSQQLDQIAGADVEAGSQAMRSAFEKLAETAADRRRSASSAVPAASSEASDKILMMVGAITLVMVGLAIVVIRMLAGPIRRLTRVVQAIASGKTDQTVPYTERRDEIGRMAASVEILRGVMRQAFIQTQMIEQLRVGVMTAEPAGEFRITYLNAEVRYILAAAKDAMTVAIDDLVGQPIGVFHPDLRQQRDRLADPAKLPHRTRITLGTETLDLRISAMFDRDGSYAGPLLTWRRATGQVRLVQQFEASIGAIARIVAEAADGMCQAASVMRQSTIAAGERTMTVAAASDQASRNVSTAAAGAEEVAISVAEIARQVTESAQISSTAVAEAQATDASVGRLTEAADRISAVVQLIGDIAARTNLLALNATIEAARAGDAGKGFAVVAGEVKNLATQTAKATQEISGQIAAIQQAIGQAVTALRSISSTIQRMNEITTIIAGSVEEQGAATQSIAQAVQHAAVGTAQVNSNIAAVTHVVEETGSKAGMVLEAATEMTGQAAALKDEVARFLVAVQQVA